MNSGAHRPLVQKPNLTAVMVNVSHYTKSATVMVLIAQEITKPTTKNSATVNDVRHLGFGVKKDDAFHLDGIAMDSLIARIMMTKNYALARDQL